MGVVAAGGLAPGAAHPAAEAAPAPVEAALEQKREGASSPLLVVEWEKATGAAPANSCTLPLLPPRRGGSFPLLVTGSGALLPRRGGSFPLLETGSGALLPRRGSGTAKQARLEEAAAAALAGGPTTMLSTKRGRLRGSWLLFDGSKLEGSCDSGGAGVWRCNRAAIAGLNGGG